MRAVAQHFKVFWLEAVDVGDCSFEVELGKVLWLSCQLHCRQGNRSAEEKGERKGEINSPFKGSTWSR